MNSNLSITKNARNLGKRHVEVMDELERMLDQGESFATMSEVAKTLKISLRTLYEIAPSKEEQYITAFIKSLLDDAKSNNEIQDIDTQATAMLLGGLGRYFQAKTLLKDLKQTPEQTSNFFTQVIINGIKLEN